MSYQGFKGGKLYVSGAELEAIHTYLGDNPAFGGFWRKVAGIQSGSIIPAPISDKQMLYGGSGKRFAGKVAIPDDIALIQIAMSQGLEISEDEESRLNSWMAGSLKAAQVNLDDI